VFAYREFLDPERWVMYDGVNFRVELDGTISPGTVKFDSDTHVCRVSPKSGCTTAVTIEKRLRREAHDTIPRIAKEHAAHFGVDVDRITLRNQKTRWGSSSSKRTISLNWRIIMASREVRDYLIIHELAHQRHMNHSKEFWSLVASWCPGYRFCDSWLSEHAYLLSIFRR
jgi:predicted metal-dependent hydrolase